MKYKSALSMMCLLALYGTSEASVKCNNGLRLPVTASSPHSGRAVTDPELLNRAQPRAASAPAGTLDNQGEIDGVYACTVTLTTNGVTGAPFNATISVNGHADGSEELLVAAESATQQLSGYGAGMIGDVDDMTFHGTNSFNQPFTLKAAYASSTGGKTDDELTLNGTFGISPAQTANLNCMAK